MTRPSALLVFPLLLIGCDDFIEMIAESPCVNNDDAEACEQGERAGSLEGTSNQHCCENDVYRTPTPQTCSLTADQRSELFGEIASYLEISSNTRVTLDIRAFRYEAFHELREGHCEKHDDECDDELIGREWRLIGKVQIHDNLQGKVENLQDLAREMGIDPGSLTINVTASDKAVMAAKGVLASICEERDHDSCPAVDLDPPELIAVTRETEEQLREQIPGILDPPTETP